MIYAPSEPDPDEDLLKIEVTRVFDGDGFLANVWHPLRNAWVPKIAVRLAYIDAPEMAQQCGPESQRFLSSLIQGKPLELSLRGRESVGYVPIDDYGRISGVAYLSETMPAGEIGYFLGDKCSSGRLRKSRPVTRNIELEMLVNGWAWEARRWEYPEEKTYSVAEQFAFKNRLGIWAQEDPEPPWTFKARQKRRKKALSREPELFSGKKMQCSNEGCTGHLVERSGKNGPFLGCSKFPACRFTKSVSD